MRDPKQTKTRERLNSVLRSLFSRFGLDVRLKQNLERNRELEALEEWQRQWRFLSCYHPQTILDIGANEGQFAGMIRGVCPDATIISFEPLPACCPALEKVVDTIGNARFSNIGIGDRNGAMDMFLSSSSPSSSMLSMNRTHKIEWPESSENRPVSVQTRRLDNAVDLSAMKRPFTIKMDVQGAEDKVIAGGVETIRQAEVVVIETSFVSLYNGQPLFDDIYEQMKSLGFIYRGALDTSWSNNENLILQEDSVFINPDQAGCECRERTQVV